MYLAKPCHRFMGRDRTNFTVFRFYFFVTMDLAFHALFSVLVLEMRKSPLS